MPHSNPDRRVEILLVEDSRDDALLMTAALSEGTLLPHVTWLEDGEEAMCYLRRQGAYAASRRPDLILLDLRLPRMSGQEVLTEVKQDDDLRRIPVVIMTSSDNDRIINAVYDLHANCCVCKPADQEEYREVVRRIERFWLTFAQRPKGA
jgi:chemotaxis family two-component system response regulator Rcp1